MSKQVKHYFTQTPLTQNLLIIIGQTTHQITTRMTIWSAGYKVKNIQSLEKDKAVKQGADFIGEFFVFGVAGALVVWEYDKSKKKEVTKDQKVQRQIESVKIDMEIKIETLENKIDELEKLMRLIHDSLEEERQQEEWRRLQNRRKGWLW